LNSKLGCYFVFQRNGTANGKAASIGPYKQLDMYKMP